VNTEKLEAIVAELTTRPGHTKVTALLYKLLTDALNADSRLIDFERPMPEVRGRVDALLGRTVFEVKSDLTREKSDAEAQLLRYMPQRELETGQTFTGITTDGAEFDVYIVRGSDLIEISSFRPTIEDAAKFLGWLESVVVLTAEIRPTVASIQQELGRESVAYHRAIRDIELMWESVRGNQEAVLKRDIWNRLVSVAYGGEIDAPGLFFQHTYLTIVAKAIATAALFNELPKNGTALLDGEQFKDLGVIGAVEADFFDWILSAPGGDGFVMKVVRHANRFRLRDIEVDILKGLYESLIDPEQRHDLGEYYTPDWLAQRVCERAIAKPLDDRVIDPACGSGTFLFHALRGLLNAAKKAKLKPAVAVELATSKVTGVDIHPVAIIFARVTYLLALGPTLLAGRPPTVTVPVYLGDALLWNAKDFMGVQELEVVVPPAGDQPGSILRFPLALAREPGSFDATINEMLSLAVKGAAGAVLAAWIKRRKIANEPDTATLLATYEAFVALQNERRNHIWAYVVRNLSRPIWLSSDAQKADVVIGNPPWLAYSRMASPMQVRFRQEMKDSELWGGMHSVAAFDLAAYFFVRAIWLYMRKQGSIAFVLPYAAMFKKPYQRFRSGSYRFGLKKENVEFFDAWAFPSDVQPLFPVPACVLFARRSREEKPLPKDVLFFNGQLPRRDAHLAEAKSALTETRAPWPEDESSTPGSSYRKRFRQGAILIPRRFVLVERAVAGRLGGNPSAPVVRGRTGTQDKKPWKNISPPQGPVESTFLHKVYLGESVLPYRFLDPLEAVIPWDEGLGDLMESATAQSRGFSKLADWLSEVEALWKKHGKDKRTFAKQLDFFGQLSSQFPVAGIRVLYSASGTNPAAALLLESTGVIEHKLYWAAVDSLEEGRYLTAVLNSEVTREKSHHWQSQGQWGARDFDKVMFNLPIPTFDPKNDLHKQLTEAAERAEQVAALATLREVHFARARSAIRKALEEDGVAALIDKLVGDLLP
jgi:SAM-dependent methyltransferase